MDYVLSLTLEAEYMEYRGQGKRATPEEMFKMSPFRLKGKGAKLRMRCCLLHPVNAGDPTLTRGHAH